MLYMNKKTGRVWDITDPAAIKLFDKDKDFERADGEEGAPATSGSPFNERKKPQRARRKAQEEQKNDSEKVDGTF